MESLKARLQALEDFNKPSVDILLRKINALALKNGSDFDRYEALQLAQELVACASNTNHEKFSYYSVALQEIRQRLHKPKEQFKAYFLAFFFDRDYGKVLQSLAKVDKCLRNPRSSVRYAAGFTSPTCFRCGQIGHYANRYGFQPYARRNPATSVLGPKPLLR